MFFFFFDELPGEGRLVDIVNALFQKFDVSSLDNIKAEDKLAAMCCALDLSTEEFDSLIADNSPVLRTVKGHSFEVALETLLKQNQVPVQDIGGDSDVDLIVNGYTLQLKTPNEGGTNCKFIEYKTHKTHGAKSGIESMGYYHDVDSFADYFVGLISYDPFQIYIIPKAKLERHLKDERYIKSPFKLSRDLCRYINNFYDLGINVDSLDNTCILPTSKELLPKTSKTLGLQSEIIIDTILRKENFRIWDMSIRGFAREMALKRFLSKEGVPFTDKPSTVKAERGDKSDLAILKNNGSYLFFQVKGVSTNLCKFQGYDSIIATEIQLTRGRVNDHPTQSRLYMVSDFEYLVLCLEPTISNLAGLGQEWFFAMIPAERLEKHKKFPNRYKSIQHFYSKELYEYELTLERVGRIIAE